MSRKILNRKEVIAALKSGDYILWLGGATFSACLGGDFSKTVRHDTLLKLWREGLVTDYGYPELNGKVYWKEVNHVHQQEEAAPATPGSSRQSLKQHSALGWYRLFVGWADAVRREQVGEG